MTHDDDIAAAIARNTERVVLLRCLLELRRRNAMTPKLRGIAHKMKLLRHNLEIDADRLSTRIDEADGKRGAVFAKSHKTIDAAHAEMDDVDAFLTEVERSNDSPRSSEVATRRENGDGNG